MEVLLRKLIPKMKLYNFPLVISVYEKYALLRYWFLFNKKIEFRGSIFVIGRDVTLFPSVYLGTYEKCELDILLELELPDNFVFWDVGANVGLYSVVFAKKFPRSQVVSFEPNEQIHELLNENFVRNKISNARVEKSALSNYVGEGMLDLDAQRAGAARITSALEATHVSQMFPVTTGEAFLSANPSLVPQMIKIDVEGHEPEVIAGLREILVSHKPVLTLEVFRNLWVSERGEVWDLTLNSLFSIYRSAKLITDGEVSEINGWDLKLLTGGMQTLIFGTNQ